MKLFIPDIFSINKPVWTPVTDGFNFEKIREMASKFHCLKMNDRLTILKSGGSEINSKNYLININDQKFVLKNWGHDKSIHSIVEILNIQDWLSSQGQPVVSAISSDFGRVIGDDQNFKWSLFPFTEGCYYSGKDKEFEKAVLGSISLHEALRRLPSSIKVPLGHDYFTFEEVRFVETISDNRREWKRIFSSDALIILENYWDFIREKWLELLDGRHSRLSPFGMHPSHFDLHPHNVLFHSGNLVGILDFESCMQIQSEYAIFFSVLKLARQRKVVNNSRLNIQELFNGEINNKLIYEYSVIEVIRRLLIILKNDMNADRKWIHVLPIQVRLIFEAKEIFLNKTI